MFKVELEVIETKTIMEKWFAIELKTNILFAAET